MTTHLFLDLHVENYDQWKQVFDANIPLRAGHGVTQHLVYRAVDDRERVVIQLDFPSVEATRGFLGDQALKEAMKDAGVKGPANVILSEHVEQRPY